MSLTRGYRWDVIMTTEDGAELAKSFDSERGARKYADRFNELVDDETVRFQVEAVDVEAERELEAERAAELHAERMMEARLEGDSPYGGY